MDQDNTGAENPIAPDGASTTNENKPEDTSQTTVKPVSPAPVTPDLSTDPKKPKGLITTTIILAILATAGIAFGIYGMFLKPAPKCETNCQEPTSDGSGTNTQPPTEKPKEYELSDYVSFTEVSIPVTFPDEVEKGHTEDTIKRIELKNVPVSITTDFNSAQEQLVSEDTYTISRTNTVGASINGSLLSAYTIYKYDGVYRDSGKAETINYDINKQQTLSNQELADFYDITSEEVYDIVLRHLASNVTATSFLLNTHGDVSGPSISVEEFTNHIPEYNSAMPADLAPLKMYVDEDNIVHALYLESIILENLGMGTHMGIGLHGDYQDVVLQ